MAAMAAPLLAEAIADLSETQCHAIQTWVHHRIENQLRTRLEFVGQTLDQFRQLEKNVGDMDKRVEGEAWRIDAELQRFYDLITNLSNEWTSLNDQI